MSVKYDTCPGHRQPGGRFHHPASPGLYRVGWRYLCTRSHVFLWSDPWRVTRVKIVRTCDVTSRHSAAINLERWRSISTVVRPGQCLQEVGGRDSYFAAYSVNLLISCFVSEKKKKKTMNKTCGYWFWLSRNISVSYEEDNTHSAQCGLHITKMCNRPGCSRGRSAPTRKAAVSVMAVDFRALLVGSVAYRYIVGKISR